MEATLNPGCPDNICDQNDQANAITVVHIKAIGSTNCLHYVWDFTGSPTVLMALTPLNTSLTINWRHFMDADLQSVTFSKKPIYTSAVIITRVILKIT